ncbi:MAG: hypothetical protein KatS3mg068_1826 [Candidatus Sericytochromatia bacterium]|nr:MAG: hypothetical protein KatS3mg068_1826 [Candidatus Sericytochromatia bacterium]
MKLLENFEDIMIVDDYAHHPTEIKATLSSASLYQRHITVIFSTS